jgi:hypothetical protein
MRLLDAALVAAISRHAEVFGQDFKGWCAANNVSRSTAFEAAWAGAAGAREAAQVLLPAVRPGRDCYQIDATEVKLAGGA